MNPNGLMN
jgi:hypothetical protein